MTLVIVTLPIHKLLMIPNHIQSKHQLWGQTLKISYNLDLISLYLFLTTTSLSNGLSSAQLIQCIFLLICLCSYVSYLHTISLPHFQLSNPYVCTMKPGHTAPAQVTFHNVYENVFITLLTLRIITTIIFLDYQDNIHWVLIKERYKSREVIWNYFVEGLLGRRTVWIFILEE